MEKICLDTNILVNLLRNKKEEVDFIKDNESNCEFSTTSITVYELFYGALKSAKPEKNVKEVKELINDLEILEFTNSCAEKAAFIQTALEKAGNSTEIRDLFIASIAMINNTSLKTHNKKHFSNIESLKIL